MPPRKAQAPVQYPTKATPMSKSEQAADAAIVNERVAQARAQAMDRAQDNAVQPPRGRAVAIGRDGKPIWRGNMQQDHDPYARAASLAPPGWIYEFKTYSVFNQIAEAYVAKMLRQGWSFVPAQRHPGEFSFSITGGGGAKAGPAMGAVILNGLALMEIPVALYQEAKREEKQAADARVRKAKAERGLPVPAGATGIDVNDPDARRATFVKEERLLDRVSTPKGMDVIGEEEWAAAKPTYQRDLNTID